MEENKRLKLYLSTKKISQKDFASDIDSTQQYVSAVLSGKRKLGTNLIDRIKEGFDDINISWLLTGEGNMLKDDNTSLNEEPLEYQKLTPKAKGVPYFDVDFTAGFASIINNQQTSPDSYVTHPFFAGCDYIVRASGQSMAKIIKHGDAIGLIEIKNWQEFMPLGEVYAIVTSNGFRMIKVIVKGDDHNHYTLISKPSDSKKDEFTPQQIKKTTILSIYKVQASSHLF